ncbi:MAG TPA: RsmD family RNA methyltransferase [Dehalococcoidia bacterium]|nr:RsmD family RNA methyltransferase [Dehalococcoidia bacterium]
MRVIAGRAKGHRLKGLPARSRPGRAAAGVRPTSDLVRGAIFSALAAMQADLSRVLDLYAGSGALGIEALSRGAEWCDFVERDARSCAVIAENLRLTGFAEQARVLCRPVERLEAGSGGEPYTLVLADPPYGDAGALRALASLAGSGLVEPGRTVLVLEHASREEPPSRLGGLSRQGRVRRHGDSAVSMYR